MAESREKWNFLDGKLVYHFSFEFNLREFIIVSLCCVSFHISDANPVLLSPCLCPSFSFFASQVTTKTSRTSKKSYRRHRSPCFVLCTSEKTSLPSESFLAFVGLRQNGTKKFRLRYRKANSTHRAKSLCTFENSRVAEKAEAKNWVKITSTGFRPPKRRKKTIFAASLHMPRDRLCALARGRREKFTSPSNSF